VEATIAALLALAASQVIALLWVIPLAPVLAVGLLLVFSVSTAGMTIDGLRNENVREATRFHSLAASVASCVGSRTGQDGDGPIRVAALSRVIAEHVEHGARWADAVEEAALLRNLGHLVLSPEGLDGSGRDQMQGRSRGRSHLPATCAVLRNVPLSTEVRDTIASLQERWDGWGHPRGLSGPAIPLGARILALAEAIDRILGEPELDTRGHKRALSTLSGKQLDPNLVEAIESKWADLRGARLSSQAFSSPSQTRSPSPLATALKRRLESESRMLRELRSLLSRSPIIDEFNLEAVAEIVRQRLPVRALGVVDLSRELDDPLIIATRQFDSNTLLRLAYTAPTQARRDEAFVRTDVPGEPAKLIIELDAPAPQREVERVTEVLARMLRPAIVARRTTEAVRNVAFIDPLTRLGNRRAFEERKAVFLGRARALGTPFALLVIDMDNLKPLNDHHGHAAGDAALRRLADVIRGLLREEDFAARLGGDEFAVFLDGCDAAGAELVAARLETDLSQTALVLDDASLHTLHLSVGAAIWPADGDALATLLTVADQRMYACKIARKQARI
jgi:diguanylate cyclase (GGDEF)-like protein